MPLLAYNLTTNDFGIFPRNPGMVVPLPVQDFRTIVRLPASETTGVRGPATDVTELLAGLTVNQYQTLEASRQLGVEFEWTADAEFDTGGADGLDVLLNAEHRTAVFVDSVRGSDDKTGTLVNPVQTIDQAFRIAFDTWRRTYRIQLAPSAEPYVWNQPLVFLGKPVGSFATPLLIQGGFTNELGARNSTGSTPTEIVDASLGGTIRQGNGASIVAGSQPGQVLVTGLTGMKEQDVGRLLLLRPPGPPSRNGGTFTIKRVQGATTVEVANPQGLVPDPANGAIVWQESFEGGTLLFTSGSLAGQRRMIRDHGTAAPLTTFQVNAPFTGAPADGDSFVVEKPAVTINFGSNPLPATPYAFDSGTLGIQGVRFQNVSTKQLTFRFVQSQLEGVEFSLNGGTLSLSNFTAFPPGSVGAASQWSNQQELNPFADARTGVGAFIHDGIFNILQQCRAVGFFVFRNMTINVTEADFSPTSIDGKRTTINLSGSRFNHSAPATQPGRLDGQVAPSSGTGVINFRAGSRGAQVTQLQIDNSAGYGIDCQNGTEGIVLGRVTGSNAITGIRVDRRSGVTIDDGGASTTLAGILGDVEFGHETPPNRQTYATLRSPDGTQTKGFQDTHGNRVDV